ncbi:PIG-L family deacetylase [Micromonospora sp. WMMC241]|uniref:PIG-L family deacetylase n=1 Tax=Micromonospora sp. WMMC241 TaxID=3015159 RepID=UPI0022B6B10A|nr:PIG-L family deacetylase [Micromonospora sp. WMMC241]MCZ7440806.1 PIG-L family deacetylase [Micromonospora sp. WMMC241]MCZ7440867.1 PIG-L family deacetylase [Micromonospora sp. WMMC241]
MRRRALLAAAAAAGVSAAVGTAGAAQAATGRPALFVIPHPDDETLAAGVVIAEHVAAGRDVHLLLLTRGEKSAVMDGLNGTGTMGWWGVTHNPQVEGYAPLTEATFGEARRREITAAAGALGVPADHIHEAGLPNEGVTVASAKAAIVACATDIGADVGLWAPSHTVDNHADHLAAGQAVRQLGTEDPVRWWDRRYYVLPMYWSDARLSKVDWWWDYAANAQVTNRARNATRAYQGWQPANGMFAIGWHSTYSAFRTIEADPKCLVHR